MNCPICQSDTLELLGTLGQRQHLRCRDCGAQTSRLYNVRTDKDGNVWGKAQGEPEEFLGHSEEGP